LSNKKTNSFTVITLYTESTSHWWW